MPWEGYWLKTLIDGVKLTIPAPAGLSDHIPDLPGGYQPPIASPKTTTTAGGTAARVRNEGEFDLALALVSEQASDLITSLGARRTAEIGKDPLDAAEPPLMENMLAAYFEHDGSRINTDYQPVLEPGDTRQWRLTLQNTQPKTGMRLSWESALATLPHDIRLSFRRSPEAHWQSMRTVVCINFEPAHFITRETLFVRAEREKL